MTTRTGLKFYTSKPYLLVSYTGSKDNPIKVEMINMPDLEHPIYAQYHPGWGSHNFTLTVGANGTLTSYGQTADSKGPETITALGSLLSSAGAGFSSVATGLKTLRTESQDMTPVIQKLRDAVTALQDVGSKPITEVEPFLIQQTAANSFAVELNRVISNLASDKPYQKAELESIEKRITNSKVVDNESKAAGLINTAFKDASLAIKEAIELIDKGTPAPATKPDFNLFEIVMDGGATKLVPVATLEATILLKQARTRDGK